jgi:ferredoxin-type protein NapG
MAACPTEALESTAIEDSRMGLAVLLDHETCLAFQGLRCEVCYRVCPLMGSAIRIEMRPQKRTGMHAYFLPEVDSEHCTGCGRCEHACVLEEAAIRVLPRELAKGRGGEHYRFGWKEETEISRDFTAPEVPPAAEWERRMERALEAMDDVGGIEEP